MFKMYTNKVPSVTVVDDHVKSTAVGRRLESNILSKHFHLSETFDVVTL